jgi:hypothetical protein
MRLFEGRKTKVLKDKIENIKTQAEADGRFSLFHTNYANDVFNQKIDYDKYEYVYTLLEDNDKKCNLPYEAGLYLDELSKNSAVYIHRTNLFLDKNSEDVPQSDALYSIMSDGLKNFGHVNAAGGVGITNGVPPIGCTMTPMTGFTGYINLLSPWQNNDTVIVASFPKDMLDEEGNLLGDYKDSDLYDLSLDTPTIKPEYMVGAFIVSDNGLWKYYSKDKIVKSLSENNALNK